jgi:hypothetical protein
MNPSVSVALQSKLVGYKLNTFGSCTYAVFQWLRPDGSSPAEHNKTVESSQFENVQSKPPDYQALIRYNLISNILAVPMHTSEA